MANAKLIKELRDRTGAGFLDVKKALEATNEDLDKAIAWLQEKGASKAAKKANAIAAEGIVKTIVNKNHAIMFEVNSQTDFVATNALFVELVEQIGNALLKNEFKTVEQANAITIDGKTIADLCKEATARIGEKINLRRAVQVKGQVIGAYTHVNKRVAAIVVTEGGDASTARNVAMHVASMNPQFLDEKSVPEVKVQEMKAEIAESKALANKPDKIKEQIASGMLRKKLSELTLVDQEFVMEKMSVAKYLSNNGAKAIAMFRFEVGEGIEKVTTDFAAEVASQMR